MANSRSATTTPLKDNLLEEGEELEEAHAEGGGAGGGEEGRQLETEMVPGGSLAVDDLSVVTPTG